VKAVATKVDNSIHDQLVNKCNGIGCSPSEYVRNLIKKDWGLEFEKKNSKSSSAQVVANDKPNSLSVTKAKRVRIIESLDGNEIKNRVEVKKPDGSVDIYRDGRLVQTNIPPKDIGSSYRIILHEKTQ